MHVTYTRLDTTHQVLVDRLEEIIDQELKKSGLDAPQTWESHDLLRDHLAKYVTQSTNFPADGLKTVEKERGWADRS